MTDVFLERTFVPPLTEADVEALEEGGTECFDLHRVEWRQSLLARDRDRMLCWFHAPDTESVRIALRQLGADMRTLWPGTVHDAPRPAHPDVAANVVVERSFETPVEMEAIQAIEDAAAWCLEAHRVKFVRSFFSLDRRRMICLYEGPDAESVRLAQRQAVMPVDLVWAFRPVAPRPSSSAACEW